ncbi:Histidine kinase-, DNA gyrase B-, and HSP90-like ATPase [Desulfacinum infernum DSM 9756]|uniref:Histidine kinase-, DNA gyrase B-, and HSP90-like ATPase n=1 Tax=Desulfacinum infernum DSM 9756 TaxID=1121391 RepID=A0A1M5J714_9BACT|nr:ATP-binding protein [Desulfacinum infernum]SHG36291.1 Histidine kinase-, DNA gyrase B-, and HSP90-like ATPase [Desulfacinum infernum DSM 9756]
MTENDHPYRMTIDLNVLDHLGINLYSNVAAVLTEVVANAWDADAECVTISFDIDNNIIVVEDDGIGMTIQDMNEKYLRVGYRRREAEPTVTEKGRKVMGRKGLGKLSLFSIADTVEVQSCKDGQRHGLRMNSSGIREATIERSSEYLPDVLNEDELEVTKGTVIRLTDLKKSRLGVTGSALRRRLARRFSIIGSDDFRVFIDDVEVTVRDRGDLEVVQFLWNIGDGVDYSDFCPGLKERETRSGVIDGRSEDWFVRGWIGTVSKPKQLETDAGNLNSIVVLARGRLLIENVLDKINDGRLYTKYLTGQIEADFLDRDDLDDIVTSDRQRVLENDERYEALMDFLRSLLNQVESKWSEWRRKHGAEEVTQEHPALAEWLDSLPEGYREHAKGVIAKVGAIPVEDKSDRKDLLRHAVFAFERLKLKGAADALAEALDGGIEDLLKLLADQDVLESSLYRDIVTSRLDAIRAFRSLVDENAKERVLQEFLFKDLWLLDPSWERATGSEFMESRLKAEGVIVDDMTEKERLGRVDIAYRTTAGKHVIVELKRAGRQMKLLELVEQGQKYVDALKKILAAQGNASPNIEVVFVVGRPLEEETSNPERVKSSMESISPGSRIIHYDGLIKGALDSYAAYLEASDAADRIGQLAEKL